MSTIYFTNYQKRQLVDFLKNYPCIIYQFVIFKPLSYCFEETIGFDVKTSFTRRPVSRLIKPGDVTKEF